MFSNFLFYYFISDDYDKEKLILDKAIYKYVLNIIDANQTKQNRKINSDSLFWYWCLKKKMSFITYKVSKTYIPITVNYYYYYYKYFKTLLLHDKILI